MGQMAYYTAGAGQTLTGQTLGRSASGSDYLDVQSGGRAVNTTVSSGGFLSIHNNGTADGTTLGAGGDMFMYQGGTATGTVANAGSLVQVNAGGTLTGVVLNGGGLLVAPGGKVSGLGLQPGGSADFADFLYAANTTASLDPATDILTLTGSSGTYTLQLAGDYTGETISAAGDNGIGNFGKSIGTMLTVKAAPSSITVSGAKTGQDAPRGVAIAPLAGIMLAAPAGDVLTATVTIPAQQVVNGHLQDTVGTVDDADGRYTISGSAGAVQAVTPASPRMRRGRTASRTAVRRSDSG